MLIKKRVWELNPLDDAFQFTDCEWPQRMAFKYTMGNVPHTLLRVRIHGRSLTAVKREAFFKHLARTRFRTFYTLFPNTPLRDYIAFARIADHTPATSLWELERAGQWLKKLSISPDLDLRARMSARWQAICDMSADLGDSRHDIFKHYQPLIDNIP